MYQALPEQSILFARLRTENKISTLFNRLFPYSSGPFHISELEEDELDEILNDIAEEEVFGSRTAVDREMHELQVELERANASHPGLRARNALLEKSQYAIEKRLSQELKRKNLDSASALMQKLLYGQDALAPELFESNDEQLHLVPTSVVKEGVQVLQEIEPAALFENEGNPEWYYREDFQRWRAFYLEVAAKEEAVVVDVA